MGLRSLEDGYVPPILDVAKLDPEILVTNEESVGGVRDLLDAEGIFGGVSAGAVVHVARKLAGELDEGVVVCILADGGWKYLSAGFWGCGRRAVDGAHGLVVIPADVRAELRAHEEGAPNEACGLVVTRDGVAERYVRGRNAAASPYRFELEVPPETWFLEDEGYGSPSSTPTSPRRPSRTDVENIGLWQGGRPDPHPPLGHACGVDDRGRRIDPLPLS